MTTRTYDHADQKSRRRRARVSQEDIATRLNISSGALSQYEKHGMALPWGLSPEDYERELLNAIRDKERAA